jgi:hypothetical protein
MMQQGPKEVTDFFLFLLVAEVFVLFVGLPVGFGTTRQKTRQCSNEGRETATSDFLRFSY